MISNIELKFFQMNLMLDLFVCLRLELLELLLNFYSLGVTFFSFKFCDLKFLAIVLLVHIFP